ncbi:hypothetical protein [Alloactinosynnema sp. L-07]|uniref:hypothetical protein n=1 Tax=Alloactinosynnema sp. L-07 TaxID=1653480 RepID=UPI00065EFE64|nr:hypothetical protein [Alloactinosynnema sp. L-07]CRK58374.1 hypothetical protein [Alloactinosynnema sp. L-07]
MSTLLGDKRRFAAEVGEWVGGLRRVDLWAADQWLTCDDNAAYVPRFRHAVRQTAAEVSAGYGKPQPFADLSPAAAHRRLAAATTEEEELFRERFWIFHWGPTTDNLRTFVFRDGDELVLTFQFWREAHLREHPEHAEAVFAVAIPAAEFVGILDGLVACL